MGALVRFICEPILAQDSYFMGRRLGIGITGPKAKLHIHNTAATSDGDGSATETLSGQDSILLYGHDGSTNNATHGSITWLGSASRRRAMITAVAEHTDSDYLGLAFYTQGTDGSGDFFESMRISKAGNVGIGTTAPECKLDIHDSSTATVFVSDNDAGVRITNFGGSTGWSLLGFGGFSSLYPRNLAQIGSLSANNGTYLAFGTSNSYTTGVTNQAMTIDPSGKVGIGTAAPGGLLDLATTVSTAKPDALRISNAGYPAYYWDMWRDNSTGHFNLGSASGGSFTTHITIKEDGNVGIGTN